jgi:hypothetical protein
MSRIKKVQNSSRELKTSGLVRHLRTPNGFRIHEAPRPNETIIFSRKTPNIRSFHHDWPSFGAVIYVSLPHVTSSLSPLLEGVLFYTYMTVGFDNSLVFYSLV